MSNAEVQSMLNNTVEFFYEGDEVRTVKVEVIKEANGKTLIVGRDEARNKQYRSFDVTKMKMAHII